MKKLYYILMASLLLCAACEFQLKPGDDGKPRYLVEVQRYDRIQSRYLTTGDFVALQQMNMDYPMETRTLIEDVLQLGDVSDPGINSKFLSFYQDTILQSLISDAELQYADMSDINRDLSNAFKRLKDMVPGMELPVVYAQVGALNQSIIVGDGAIGISLDKYLGESYPLYKKYYSPSQLKTMGREYIVPDCICFYLLSRYPLEKHDFRSENDKELHVAKMMWIVNNVMGKKFFKSKYVDTIGQIMGKKPHLSVEQLLKGEPGRHQ